VSLVSNNGKVLSSVSVSLLLTVDMSGFGSLKLPEQSEALLRGEHTISLRIGADKPKKKARTANKR
jgi:hypothetical protein